MKMKFLSLVVALGLVFGAGVKAQGFTKSEAPEFGCCKPDDPACFLAKWKILFNTALCKGITKLDSTIQEGCQDLCEELNQLAGITADSTKKCATALEDEKTNKNIAAIVSTVIKGGCAGLCTGAMGTCKSCQVEEVKNLCGGLCCNFPGGESLLGSCKTNYFPNGSCASFKK